MKQFHSLCFLTILLCLHGAARAGHGLDFVQNNRQWPEPVQYKADLPGGVVFFAADRFVYNYQSAEDVTRLQESIKQKKDIRHEYVRGHAYQVLFPGCNPSAIISGNGKKEYYHNYFLGNDPSKWSTGVAVYEGITYDELYPGIDLSVYSNGAAMKYDFIVAAGADPSRIHLKFDGAIPRLTQEGTLEIRTSVNTVAEQVPYVYQLIGGVKKEVPCRYAMDRKGEICFAFPEGYDRDMVLIIDPTLVFITWTGSTAPNIAGATAYDQAGNLYALAGVFGPGWPVTTGAYQTAAPGPNFVTPPPYVDIAINKYNSTGSALLYSSYLGGQDLDISHSIAINDDGEVIIAGYTASADFPVTPGCYSNTLQGPDDLFALRFNAAGTALLGATLIGGSGTEGVGISGGGGGDVAVDNMGNILCAGVTIAADFPVTPGAAQPAGGGLNGYDVCVFKFDPTCSSLLFSTYLGGSMYDAALSMQYKSTGEILICGATYSPDFPTTPATIHPTALGGADGYLTVLSADGSTILYSTYLGTPASDAGYMTAEDAAGNIYVSGYSDGGYPVSPGLYSNLPGRLFLHKLSLSLTDIASTRLGGGGGFIYPHALAVDECGSPCFAFIHNGETIPVTPNAHQSAPGGIYIGQLTADMTALNYATHLGNPLINSIPMGKAVFDQDGYLYASFDLTQFTGTFPTTPGCYAPVTLAPASDRDAISYKFKLDPSGAGAEAQINGNDTGCVPFAVQFGNNSVNAVSYLWDFGDGTTSTNAAPTHTYTLPGTYQVQLIAYNPNACITSDTSLITIYVLQHDTAYASADSTLCAPGPLVLRAPTGYQSHVWQDGSAGPTLFVSEAGLYHVVSSYLCSHRIDSFVVEKIDLTFDLGPDTTLCEPYVLKGPPIAGAAYLWSNGDVGLSFTVPASGRYWLRISKRECAFTDTVVVTYNTNIVNATDTTICNDLPVDLVLQAPGLSGGTTLWSTGSTAQEIRVQLPGTYWVTVTRGTCRNSDTTHIAYEYCECEMHIPSAFSPNGDGRNDVFRALTPLECILSNFTLSVYNRWGQRVFLSTDHRKGWDGRFGSEPADIGIYMYVVEGYTGSQAARRYRTGDVMLVR